MTVLQFLDYMAALKGIPRARAAIEEVIQRVNLSEKATAKIRTLSGGQRQRVGIAQALLGKPEFLIFDEPTKGVDVGAREEIYKLIEKLAMEQKIVIMVSSNMPELISMSDRIGVMRDGRLVNILDSEDATEDRLIKEYIGVKE